MLIDKLTVEGFRGIGQTLDLDLTAPLTVILAANGTGKTSLCDSVEWLLSGQVGRLKNEQLICEFHKQSTRVEAALNTDNGTLHLQRLIKADSTKLKRKIGNESRYSNITDIDLLAMIVPDINIGQRRSQSSMASWLRSTRFLESDSLELLIDCDDNAHHTRRLMFSSLFGVREFHEKESQLENLAKELGAASTITDSLLDIENQIKEANQELVTFTQEQSQPFYEKAFGYLKHIAGLLRISLQDDFPVAYLQILQQLRVAYASFDQNVAAKKNALEYVKTHWNEYLQSRSRLDFLTKEIDGKKADNTQIQQQLTTNQQKQKETNENWQSLHLRIGSADQFIQWITKANADASLPIHRLSAAKQQNILQTLNAASLRATKEQLEAQYNQFNTYYNRVENAYRQLEGWITNRKQAAAYNEQLKNLEMVSAKEFGDNSLDTKVAALKNKIEELQQRRKMQLSELDIMLTAGQNYLQRHPESIACPLCEHEHPSHHHLLGVVQQRVSRLSTQSSEEISATGELQHLNNELIRRNSLLEQIKLLKSQIAPTQGLLESAEKLLKEIGLPIDDPLEKGDIALTLGAMRDESYRRATQTYEQLNQYGSFLHDSSLLEGLLPTYLVQLAEWNNELRLPQTVTALSIENIENWSESFGIIRQALEGYKSRFMPILAEAEKASMALAHAIAQSNANAKTNQDKLNELASEFTVCQTRIQPVEQQWQFLSQLMPLTEQNITGVTPSIQEDIQRQQELQRFFNEAEQALQQGNSLQQNEKALKAHKQKLDKLLQRRNEAAALLSYRQKLDQGVYAIQDSVKSFVKSQIEPLSEVICALYLRAQGNQFINGIRASANAEGILDWIAELGDDGEKLENMAHLSQGQRQDLALAIFLARARSLGGTFFLDEPFIHLDDLNKVALLDTLRVIVTEKQSKPLRLVMTTSSNNLVRHLREKFSLLHDVQGNPIMRIYKLSGNPKIGIKRTEELPPEFLPNRFVPKLPAFSH